MWSLPPHSATEDIVSVTFKETVVSCVTVNVTNIHVKSPSPNPQSPKAGTPVVGKDWNGTSVIHAFVCNTSKMDLEPFYTNMLEQGLCWNKCLVCHFQLDHYWLEFVVCTAISSSFITSYLSSSFWCSTWLPLHLRQSLAARRRARVGKKRGRGGGGGRGIGTSFRILTLLW